MQEALAITKYWVHLVAAVLCDELPQESNAIFIHSQNDLQDEILSAVAAPSPTFGLYHRLYPHSPMILLNGLLKYEKAETSWGYREWVRILQGPLGVAPSDILVLSQASHTGKEAEEAVGVCAERGWKSLTVVATPSRMPRCFLTMLGVMRHRGFDLKLHCLTVPHINWGESVEKRSVIDTVVTGSRFEQFEVELGKIADYRAFYMAGDPMFSPIASIGEGLEYLKSRPH